MHVRRVTQLTEESEPFCSVVSIKTQQEVQVLLLQLTQVLLQIASNASTRCSKQSPNACCQFAYCTFVHAFTLHQYFDH